MVLILKQTTRNPRKEAHPEIRPWAYFWETCHKIRVFYRSLSCAVTGHARVNSEIIKQSFQLCGTSAQRLCCVHGAFDCVSARNSRLLGRLEVIQLYNDPFEDETGDEFDSE